MITTIGRSYLYHKPISNDCISDYTNYIIKLLRNILETNDIAVNVIVGDVICVLYNTYPTIKIHINVEHTLVLKNGRGLLANCPDGKIQSIHKEFYKVNINNLVEAELADIITEYSIPNIINIQTCDQYERFYKKLVYIAPMIYDTYFFEKTTRNINILTTFINTNEPRRKALLDDMKLANLGNINVHNCFDSSLLREMLCQTKIMINIHQTDHHHTFEELRVLPALLSGVIVISEDSPLREHVPYQHLIVWTTYDNMIQKTIEVLQNYDFYHSRIFTPDNITLFNTLHQQNSIGIKEKLLSYSQTKMNDTLAYYAEHYVLDKSITTNNHNYIPGYASLFDGIRNNVKHVLEIGIGSLENDQMGGPSGPLASLGYKTGNSLRCWRDYFPHATIYGIDIYEHKLEEERIRTFQADQSSSVDLSRVVSDIPSSLDIIIDDGSHYPMHQVFSFMFLEKYLSPNGIYVIEDIQPPFIEKFMDLSIFSDSFREHILQHYHVQYFDTRHVLNRQDDFMIAFRKK